MGSDESKYDDKVSNAIDAVTSLTKAIPIYDDALKPLAQETGKALSTVGKAVNSALMPIRGFVWGAEKIEEWIATTVTNKLEGTPKEEIITPDLAIAGPTIEALKFNGHKPQLSDMFAGLIAGAMRSGTAPFAHPSFVEKIKLMSTFDAKVFAFIVENNPIPTMKVNILKAGLSGIKTLAEFANEAFLEIASSEHPVSIQR